MWIVLFVIMLDIIGFGIIIPTFPFFVRDLGGGPEVMTLCLALYSGTLFISTPILGRLSDRYGRKPIMAISLLGAFAGYILLAFADSILMVALSRILGGIMAGNFGAAQAYIADISDEKDRARLMGYYGAALGLGFVIGPAIGSLLGGSSVENVNFLLPALAAASMTLTAFFGVIFFVKESLPVDARQPINHPHISLISSFKDILNRKLLLLVIICGSLFQLSAGFFEAIIPLWAADNAVIDGPSDMLPMLFISGLTLVIVQSACIAPLTRRFSEVSLLRYCSLGVMSSMLLITIAADHASLFWVTVCLSMLYGFAGVVSTCAQTLVSKAAATHERGAVLGVFSSVGTMGRTATTILGGIFYGKLYLHSPFYAAATLMLCLFFVSFRLSKLEVINN